MASSRRIVSVALLLVVLLAVACKPPSLEPDVTEGPSLMPEVFVFPGPIEKILISSEDIPQPNCDGGAEMSQEVERTHTVVRTLDLGTQITVDANGQAGIPGVGQIGVGVAVAAYYQVGYGTQDAVARKIIVKAKEGTNILHTVRQYEIWETGELLVIAGGVNQRLPYRFRRDFTMEMLPSANIGCPGQAVTPTSTSTLTLSSGDTPTPSATPTQVQCVHPETLAAQRGWEGRGIVDVYGGYEVVLSATSELPPLWEANGERQIRQLDPDRTMTAGVWTIYTPYDCRDDFDFDR